MHIPDDPLFYEKFYFTPGDLGFPALGHTLRPHRRARLLGPVVSGGRPAHGAERRRRSSSIPRPSAGIPPRRRSTATQQQRPGRRSSAAHAIANGVLRRGGRTASGHEGAGDGGHRVLGRQLRLPIPAAVSSPRRRRRGGDPDRRHATSAQSTSAAPTGRSCATAASTPTGTSRGRYLGLTTRPLFATTACPPSGSRTRRPGSPGRTRKRPGPASSSPCPRSSRRWCGTSPSTKRCTSTSQDAAMESRGPAAARR